MSLSYSYMPYSGYTWQMHAGLVPHHAVCRYNMMHAILSNTEQQHMKA